MPYRVIVVDAYDSFVHILVSYFEQLGCKVTVLRKDDPGLLALIDPLYSDIIVPGPGPGPGPGHPSQSGYDIILNKNSGRLPVLGVCLGHQAIGLYYGCIIKYAKNLMHGKTSLIKHDGQGCYVSLNSRTLKVMRYHSIIVANKDIPSHMAVTSYSIDDNYIMGLRHQSFPIESVQFHPESIATECGLDLIKNFITTYTFNKKGCKYEELH
ncbi:anthranilate synthase component II [Xylella fastidiosa]|uniref:anthranilate synthase component II n=1 Tax=Xylella fastidiosa TaxID=2371 RepID=UPI00049A7F21|nr:aminodeoxychorismate/anthranilate synthase component II [Xylella fastidiosa]AIC12410.1 anthranilate synthase subunit II [Xylella fastidiosa MUL0034]